jgi:hypothetical protein
VIFGAPDFREEIGVAVSMEHQLSLFLRGSRLKVGSHHHGCPSMIERFDSDPAGNTSQIHLVLSGPQSLVAGDEIKGHIRSERALRVGGRGRDQSNDGSTEQIGFHFQSPFRF